MEAMAESMEESGGMTGYQKVMMGVQVCKFAKSMHGIASGASQFAFGVSAFSKYAMGSIGMGRVAMTGQMQLTVNMMGTASKFGVTLSANAAKTIVKGMGVLAAVGVVFDAMTIFTTVSNMVNGELNEMSVKLRDI